ncbi:MAG: ABC transporter permease subunit [Ruminococcus sp.]|nr:ABC transporter permease subunit [Ruminococcus sp.]
MSKLLSAELNRMVKSKLFWIAVAAMTICEIYCIQFGARVNKSGDVTLEQYYFYLAPMVGIFFAVFISLFLGTEHSDSTIRNKMIIGHTRVQMYFSYYLTCLIGAVIMEIGWFLGGLTGVPLLGSFTSDTKMLAVYFISILLFTAALTALSVGISLIMPNKAGSAVLQIILVLMLLFLSAETYNGLCEPEESAGYILSETGQLVMDEPKPNPRYIGGLLRTVYTWVVNISPMGQGILILHRSASDAEAVPYLPTLQILSSFIMTALFLGIGITVFRKKDLK